MVIDIHTHVGSLGVAGGERIDPAELTDDYELREEIMEQNGIDKAVILPAINYDKTAGIEATRTLNDRVRAIVDSHEKIVRGVATVEPTHGEQAVEELDRIADQGFKAIGWHHRFQGAAIDESVTKQCMRRADDLGLTVFIHCLPSSNLEALWRVRDVAGHTDQPIVIMDAFADYDNLQVAIDLCEEFDHLYFDTALMFSIGRVVETFTQEVGADRLVFGSDLYTSPLMYNYSPDLFQVRHADISEEERSLVLEENAKRLLEL